MNRLPRTMTDADHTNLLRQRLDQVQNQADRETRQLNRRDGVHPEVHSMGETISAYSLHPSYSWPSPVPGRPRVKT